MAKLSSTVCSFFLRIFLLVSFALLVAVFGASALLTIWPNIATSADNSYFGVWSKTVTTTESGTTATITSNVSWIGWTLVGIAIFALILAAVVQVIGRRTKFTIGSRNQIMGYFSSVILPVIIYVVFAFVGSYKFNNLTVPGYSGTLDSMLFASTSVIATNPTFPLLISITAGTWVWWIFFIVAIICAFNIAFTTIKMIFRAVFSKTYDRRGIAE